MSLTAPATGSTLPEFLAPARRRRLYIHDTSVINDPRYVRPFMTAQHFFPERALWLAGPDDTVLLARPAETAYLDYMRSLGAGPQQTLVAPADHDVGATQAILAAPSWVTELQSWADAESTSIEVSTFCTTGDTVQLTDILRRHLSNVLPEFADAAATYRANHKSTVRSALPQLGIAEVPGCVVSTDGLDRAAAVERLQAAVADIAYQHARVIVRADYASGGAGNLIVEPGDTTALASFITEHAQTRTFVVEGYLPWRSSPNVQYWIGAEGTTELIQITDQRMNEQSSYVGNRYPAATHADPELLRQSRVVADWLAGNGVRGVIGMDFIDTYEAGMRFVEVNARVNGATYATAMSMRLNHLRAQWGRPTLDVWQMIRGVPTKLPDFAALRQAAGEFLYDHAKSAGVVPYWTGALQHGICSCLTLGEDEEQVAALEAEFLQRVSTA